jgi:uncharacterized protein (TIGR02118 family)
VIRNLVLYTRPNDPEAFKAHYVSRHLPLCRAIPGTLNIEHAFDVETMQGLGDWFCVYQADYANETAFEAAKASPEAAAAAADVTNYSPDPPLVLVFRIEE